MEKEEKKGLVGIVATDSMDKSRLVIISTSRKHPLYGKIVSYKKKYMAHDENNASKRGDKVLMKRTIPLSKRKRMEITEILEKAK